MPFRKWYGNMAQLWSLLASDLKFAIFTATATTLTRQLIFANLMLDPTELFILELDANRSNIVYVTQHIENNIDLESIFSDIIMDIAANGKDAKRVLIFCQTLKLLCKLFLFRNLCDTASRIQSQCFKSNNSCLEVKRMEY